MNRKSILRILGLKKDKVLTGPDRLEIEIINYCNINCFTCWFFSPLGPNKKFKPWKMEIKVFRRIIKEAKDLGVGSVCIPGIGEPTLHPDFPEMLLEVKKTDLPLHIATNLTTTSPKVLKHLLLCDRIDVTLLAPNNALYKKIQSPKSDNHFENIVDNFHYLKSNRVNKHQILSIVFIPNKLNFKYFEKMIEFVQKHNIDKLEIQAFDPTKHNKKLSLNTTQLKEFQHIKNVLKRKLDFIEDSYFNLFYQDKRTSSSWGKCYMGYYTILVGIRGWVRVGCFHPLSTPAGNVYKQRLSEIWYSPLAQKIRDDFKYHFKKVHKESKCCPFSLRNEFVEKQLQKSKY